MSHVPEPVADQEHRMAPSTHIAAVPRHTVFDSLARLGSLTASVTVASLDEGIEKLLQSVQRLRDLQQSLRAVASIKHRVMMLDVGKEPVKNGPLNNLIPLPWNKRSARFQGDACVSFV
jgi:hypothetical protein